MSDVCRCRRWFAVMIMVSIGAPSAGTRFPILRRHPPTSSIVMLTTVIVVVATHDLSLGVLAGVLLSGIFFAGKVQRMFTVEREGSADGATGDLPRNAAKSSSPRSSASPGPSRR
jgi:MFS superfamily sulfate permease-like transporter